MTEEVQEQNKTVSEQLSNIEYLLDNILDVLIVIEERMRPG